MTQPKLSGFPSSVVTTEGARAPGRRKRRIENEMVSELECFHCLKLAHWRDNCPLLEPPENRKQHQERIAEIVLRFTERQIGPAAKTRMIEKENELWKKKQKELARK